MTQARQTQRSSEALGIILNLSVLMEKKKIRLSQLEQSFIRAVNAGTVTADEFYFLKRIQKRHIK